MFSLDPRRDSECSMIQQFEVNSLALPRSSLLLGDVSQKGNSLAQELFDFCGGTFPEADKSFDKLGCAHYKNLNLSVFVIGL